MTEEQEQRQLLAWVQLQYPNLHYTEDLGGIRLPPGLAKKVKKNRPRRGHPDMMFQKAFRVYDTIVYTGLAIEFKRKKEVIQNRNGSLRKSDHLKEQYDYLMALRKEGWFSCFACGFTEAQGIINAYMSEDIAKIRAIEDNVFPSMKRT